jgi:hypothetical protein
VLPPARTNHQHFHSFTASPLGKTTAAAADCEGGC